MKPEFAVKVRCHKSYTGDHCAIISPDSIYWCERPYYRVIVDFSHGSAIMLVVTCRLKEIYPKLSINKNMGMRDRVKVRIFPKKYLCSCAAAAGIRPFHALCVTLI